MRLTEKQKESIISAFIEVFGKLDAELWLFGSRVDDQKLGGDIDLLIKCYKDYNELLDLENKYDYLLQKEIGLRKIDIVLEFKPSCSIKPVIVNAKKEGILLTRTSVDKEKGMLKDQGILYKKLQDCIHVINFNLETTEKIEKVIKTLKVYPMTEQSLIELPLEKKMSIDSLIYRFLIIQDYASTKLFPLLVQIITNDPKQLPWFDVLALMEKNQIITSEEQWNNLRKLRHLLAHEYEVIPDLRAIDVNRLIESLPMLYKQAELMNNYVKEVLHKN